MIGRQKALADHCKMCRAIDLTYTACGIGGGGAVVRCEACGSVSIWKRADVSRYSRDATRRISATFQSLTRRKAE